VAHCEHAIGDKLQVLRCVALRQCFRSLQAPRVKDISAVPAEPFLRRLPPAATLLKNVQPDADPNPDSWAVLATMQLLAAASRPLVESQAAVARAGEAPSGVLQYCVVPLLVVRSGIRCLCWSRGCVSVSCAGGLRVVPLLAVRGSACA
jgi:hypothetical protein